jgi:membrane associated rhomboid family serine protease
MRYYSSHQRRPSWGSFFTRGVVNKLILANVIAFFLEFIFAPHFIQIFALTPRDVVQKFYFWQLVTYMFLHGGFFHLFFNLLMTCFLGNTLESVWGSQKFMKYYLTCGLGGAAFFMIFNFNSIVVGASAAVFGLYIAYGILFPNNYVYIYFLFPIRAKYFVTFIALFQLAYGISGPSGIAYFAHIGGMAAGLLFFRREIMNTRFWRRTSRWWGSYQQTRREEWEEQETAKIDSILDKIANKGYSNLSSTEKRILENYSRKHKEDSE